MSWPKRGRKHRPGGVSSISSYPVTMQAPHVQDPSPRAHCPSLTSHTCTHTTAFVTYKRRTFPVCGPGHPNISKSPGPGGPLPCGKRTLGSVGLTQLSFSLSLLFIPPLNFFLNLSLHHSLSLSASLAISLLQCLSHHLSLSQSLLINPPPSLSNVHSFTRNVFLKISRYPSQYLALSMSHNLMPLLISLPISISPLPPFLPLSHPSQTTSLSLPLSLIHTSTRGREPNTQGYPQRHTCVCTTWGTHLMCSTYSFCVNPFLGLYPTCGSFIGQLRLYLDLQTSEGEES